MKIQFGNSCSSKWRWWWYRRDAVLWVGVGIIVTESFLRFSDISRFQLHQGVFHIERRALLNTPNNNDIQRRNIPVFYNVYLNPDAEPNETSYVQELVDGQLSHFIPNVHYPVYVHTIGKKALVIPNTTLLGHHDQAFEEVTLHSLWEYCRNHTDQAVVYLHSKGSFHGDVKNHLMREFVTRAALSHECAVAVGNDDDVDNNDNGNDYHNHRRCNLCSARFSPTPHPHAPGNMWMAHCSYVATLIDPLDFQQRMSNLPHLANNRKGRFRHWAIGWDRWASEHWIASRGVHLRPCDLYPSPNLTWGYGGVPNLTDFDNDDDDGNESIALSLSMFDLQPAPRFDWEIWKSPMFMRYASSIEHRWLEYEFLYNETPPFPPPLSSHSSDEDGNENISNTIWWGWRLQGWVDEATAWNGTPPSS